jgi:hypothetical protein
VSIVRAPRPETKFYILDKSISEDKRLGWAARGFLIYLLGKPDHWQVSIQALVNEVSEASEKSARDRTYSIISQLIEAGYITRTQGKGEGGKFSSYDYVVSETPLTDLPDTDCPDTGEPHPVKPTQVRNELKQELKKATLVTAEAETPPAPEAVQHEKIRELYNRILGGVLPRCLGLSDKHRKHIHAAYNLKLDGKFPVREGGLEFWEGLFNDVLDCPFLLGTNGRAWKADFAFLTTATKIQSFMEGKYDAS